MLCYAKTEYNSYARGYSPQIGRSEGKSATRALNGCGHTCLIYFDPMAKKSRNIEVTQVTQWEDGKATRVEDYLAAEEPLEMRAGRYSLGITLRTPGDDEELVAGFLFTEGIISRREDLVSLRMASDTDPQKNLVRVTLDPSVRLAAGSAARRFSAGSACGVCGKASITQLRRRGLASSPGCCAVRS